MKYYLLFAAALACTPIFAQQFTDPLADVSQPHHLLDHHHMQQPEPLFDAHQRDMQLYQQMRAPQRAEQSDGQVLMLDKREKYEGGNPKAKTEYTYDENGQTVQTLSFVWEEAKWEYSEKTETSYATDSKSYTETNYKWQDNQWVATSKTEIAYDAAGNYSGYASYNREDGQWVGTYKSTYTYNAAGNQTEYASYRWNQGEWEYSYGMEYNYDASGNRTEYIGYNYTNGQIEPSNRTEYTYDPAGNLRFETTFIYRSGEWEKAYRYEYVYKNGLLVREMYYDTNGDEWWISTTYERTYDEAGRVTVLTVYQSDRAYSYEYQYYGSTDIRTGTKYYELQDNGQWKCMDYTESYYDERGRYIGYESFLLGEGQWIKQEGQWIEIDGEWVWQDEQEIWQEGEWEGYGKGEYIFDDINNTRKEVYYAWQDGKWVEASYTIYYYSLHSTGIEAVMLVPQCEGVRKMLKDGKVTITTESGKYGLGGERIE